LLLGLPVATQPLPVPRLKAAYLINLVQFVEWPTDAAPAGGALTVCIINDEAIALAFELTVDARKVAGRTLTVVRPDASAALPMCHVVYLAASAHNRAPGVIGDLKGKLVLTVSDIPNFAETGGMVQLFVEGGRIRIAVNVDALQRERPIELSSTRARDNRAGCTHSLATECEPASV
jgi:hypothetical protein